ncbi:DUF222 domain-containing protein [Microbacterium sp. P06]|uniref:HNH endonuclease n=1 Tax=Microbacterium sp. P06 TaxID=3366949 RepID=UPI00374689E0
MLPISPVAAEINRQSRPELGKDSLARKQGFRNPATLISATTGTSVGEAARIMAVGEATAPRMTLTGQAKPARHPHVAKAVSAGLIGTPASSAIITMLDRVALRAHPGALLQMERRLAEAAAGLTLEQLQKLIQRAEADLDPDGVEAREAELHAERALTFREERSGAIVINGRLDPETAAPVKAAVEGLVAGMLRRRDDNNAVPGGAVVEDARSVKQMQADALAQVARHALGCGEIPTGVTTTIVVRVNLETIEQGFGSATIDGIHQPVSAATVRRMAADAQVIPCVLGGASEILDWGRARRLFTPAQKLAAAERDGGCSGCGLPPSMTEVHHILWWSRHHGPTDLDNALLLCTSCHHRVHDDGWEIRIDGKGVNARVWFTPPASVDPARTPRLGGKARFDLAA